jgi:hypothetical protein
MEALEVAAQMLLAVDWLRLLVAVLVSVLVLVLVLLG